MPLFDPYIPVRYVRALTGLIESVAPGDLAAILKGAALCAADMDESSQHLTIQQVDRLIQVAMQVLEREDIGFEWGMLLGLDSHGALSPMFRNARTLGELLHVAAFYHHLVTPVFRARMQRGELQSEYIVHPAAGMSAGTLYQLMETQAVSLFLGISSVLGYVSDVKIHVSMRRPAHIARYHALSRESFHFHVGGVPKVRVVVPTSLLDRPLRQSRMAAPVDRTGLVAAVQQVRPTREIGGWIKLLLSEVEGAQLTRADFAAMLNVCPRTVTRMLASEGINLRQLANDIRYRRAAHLLDTTAQPVEAIAARLGYGSSSAFIGAFQKVAGVTPGEFRMQMGKRSSFDQS
ncbi:AraC family transcriptional regulator ligand-binding domain-containing protein [Duganella sp. LX20W]|uniref:AraC family transcriptional regulator ligand-binding domain-containing protein n=1 Tax=Rugamonas brunnea TaxID=2758569 RepID=A0A7W2IDX2_9BURK|nr:AraC family transcriptional regulator [Rugamonas brunnea]MBA5639869.1 AraC family transcriptional regulator ligand-binding domain-containing protein [Rugamonas brunnea]